MNSVGRKTSNHSDNSQVETRNVPPQEMQKVQDFAKEYIRLQFKLNELKAEKQNLERKTPGNK